MHNEIFSTATIEVKHFGRLLGAHFDCFLNWMKRYGYSCGTMRSYIRGVIYFGQYLLRRNIRSIHQLEGVAGKKLLANYQRYCKHRGCWRRIFGPKLYLKSLVDTGVIASAVSGDSLLLHETQQYINFLRDQRCLSENTITTHIYWVEKFLRFLGCQESTSSLPTFGIADVDRFIEQKGYRLKPITQRSLATALRSFLRFLYQLGKLTTDLSCLVTSPRCYKLSSLPQVLSWDEIQKVLSSVNCSTSNGSRDYAVLILLSTYGLRAGEVAQLKLEDIDWRKGTIHITPRKMGKDLWLPLTSQVGKALIKYLKHGRPASKYRQIFLLSYAPRTPINRKNIGYVVNRYIRLAGLKPQQHGSHLFRHSFATHLIRAGVPLKQISDMLGHRSTESTCIYTKNATEQLREVALEVPEVR
jgi:site-specific recombinase XerD